MKELLNLFVGVILGMCIYMTFFEREVTQTEETRVIDIDSLLIDITHREEPYYCFLDPECVKLAEAMYFEARGEKEKGMYAVGLVIMNRVESHRFPDTIVEVVHERKQFSYLTDRRVKHKVGNISLDDLPLKLARNVILGKVEDFTNGADHYYNPKKVKRTPRFAKKYENVYAYANHKFYRSVML